MSRYYLGVDIGGTKSIAWLCDDNGNLLGVGWGGAGIHRDDDYSVTTRVLNDITAQAVNDTGITRADVRAACFGIAGYDWESQRQPHLDAIAALNLNAEIELVNDTLLMMHADSTSGSGIALIAGTGCNCLGQMADGRSGRAVGEGYLMGEGAGATELVLQAKYAVAAAWTLTAPPTMLTELFMAYTKADTETDLIEGLVTQRYRLNPDAAPLVFRAAEAGDDVAMNLVQWAAQALASMVYGVARQMRISDEPVDVVMGGSFFNAGPLLMQPLQACIRAEIPTARFVRMTAPPVAGAVLMAMRRDGLSPEQITVAHEQLLTYAQTPLHIPAQNIDAIGKVRQAGQRRT